MSEKYSYWFNCLSDGSLMSQQQQIFHSYFKVVICIEEKSELKNNTVEAA